MLTALMSDEFAFSPTKPNYRLLKAIAAKTVAILSGYGQLAPNHQLPDFRPSRDFWGPILNRPVDGKLANTPKVPSGEGPAKASRAAGVVKKAFSSFAALLLLRPAAGGANAFQALRHDADEEEEGGGVRFFPAAYIEPVRHDSEPRLSSSGASLGGKKPNDP